MTSVLESPPTSMGASQMLHNFSYGAFGDGGRAESFGYTGRWGGYTDERLGQVLNWHRWYSAEAGQWLNSDPIGQMGSLNLYSYVDGNPILYIDPAGLKGCDCLYVIVTGKLICSSGGKVVFDGQAWSGLRRYQNDPSKTSREGGPIPVGSYIMSNPMKYKKVKDPATGKWVPYSKNDPKKRIHLEPTDDTETYGRTDFQMHYGGPGGSEGCPVPYLPKADGKNYRAWDDLKKACPNGGNLSVQK